MKIKLVVPNRHTMPALSDDLGPWVVDYGTESVMIDTENVKDYAILWSILWQHDTVFKAKNDVEIYRSIDKYSYRDIETFKKWRACKNEIQYIEEVLDIIVESNGLWTTIQDRCNRKIEAVWIKD